MFSALTLLEMARNPIWGARLIRQVLRERLTPLNLREIPYFDTDGIVFFSTILTKQPLIYEYGSGGSTIFAAARGATVVSVESSRRWARAVNARLLQISRASTAKSVYVDIGPTKDYGRPADIHPSRTRLLSWANYVNTPWKLGGVAARPDYILIDGRFRVACCALASFEIRKRELNDCQIVFDDFFIRAQYSAVLSCCRILERHGSLAILVPRFDFFSEEAMTLYSESLRFPE
jgi:hypothetical protein